MSDLGLKDWIKTGVRCPHCKSDDLRACGLEDTPFASVDHFVCEKCGTRWMFAHTIVPKDVKDIEIQLKDSFIWVLHTHKAGEITLDYAPLKSETKGDDL
jgi:Zn ribbon nucleic-acid-binding protein